MRLTLTQPRTACATKYSPKPIAAGNPNARAVAIVKWMMTRLSSSLLDVSLEGAAGEIVSFPTSPFSARGLFGTITGFQFGRRFMAIFSTPDRFEPEYNQQERHLFRDTAADRHRTAARGLSKGRPAELCHSKFVSARSTFVISLCAIDSVWPSSHLIVTPLHVTSTTIPRSAVFLSQRTRSPTLSCLDCSPVILSRPLRLQPAITMATYRAVRNSDGPEKTDGNSQGQAAVWHTSLVLISDRDVALNHHAARSFILSAESL